MLPTAVDTAKESVEVKADRFSELAVAFMTAVENGICQEFELRAEEVSASAEESEDTFITYAIHDVKAKMVKDPDGETTGENVPVEFGVKVPAENGETEIVEVKDGLFTLPAKTAEFTLIARGVTEDTAAENEKLSVSFSVGIDSVRIGNDTCPVRYESKTGDGS
ncbi:hypothetical protein ACTQ56_11445 [[Clostridium] aminophilum]|uniref:hypothetical protein n=1 Tax=[Clostridium] aminophilum TaxID=1526 RepID=UPI003F9667C1